jgi:hypothetical protein
MVGRYMCSPSPWSHPSRPSADAETTPDDVKPSCAAPATTCSGRSGPSAPIFIVAPVAPCSENRPGSVAWKLVVVHLPTRHEVVFVAQNAFRLSPWTPIAAAVSPPDMRRSDMRDKEIYRFGEYVSRWFVIAGAAAAFGMAIAKWDYFWIANVIYLGFVLWAVAGSVVRLIAYRRGL